MATSTLREQLRPFLKAQNFKAVFNEMGWDNASGQHTLSVDGETFTFQAVAAKARLTAYLCQVENLSALPYKTQIELDAGLTKLMAEHIIIFADGRWQTWQWVKREAGRPNAVRRQGPI